MQDSAFSSAPWLNSSFYVAPKKVEVLITELRSNNYIASETLLTAKPEEQIKQIEEIVFRKTVDKIKNIENFSNLVLSFKNDKTAIFEYPVKFEVFVDKKPFMNKEIVFQVPIQIGKISQLINVD